MPERRTYTLPMAMCAVRGQAPDTPRLSGRPFGRRQKPPKGRCPSAPRWGAFTPASPAGRGSGTPLRFGPDPRPPGLGRSSGGARGFRPSSVAPLPADGSPRSPLPLPAVSVSQNPARRPRKPGRGVKGMRGTLGCPALAERPLDALGGRLRSCQGCRRAKRPAPLPRGEQGVKAPQRGAEGQRPLGGFSRSKHDLRGPAERLSDLAQPGPFYRYRRGGVETIGFLRVSFDDCSVWRELRSV